MISWDEYISSLVSQLREQVRAYFKLPDSKIEDFLEWIETYPFIAVFTENCQISVIAFKKKPGIILWIVRNDYHLADKKVDVHKETEKDVEEYLRNEFPSFEGMMGSFSHRSSVRSNEKMEIEWVLINKCIVVYEFYYDPREEPIQDLVSSIFGDLTRRSLYEHMESTADSLRVIVGQIVDKTLKEELLVVTNKMQVSIDQARRIDEYERKLAFVEDELGGVRKLVGTRSFGEWRTLLSDIDRLKEEHVPKEVFDARVSELHIRINSVSEMKTEYDKLLAQQNEFMKQQAEVMKQQASFVTWIKYSTILMPIAAITIPIIEITRILLGIH